MLLYSRMNCIPRVLGIEYKVISIKAVNATTMDMGRFMDQINSFLWDGWEPQGGISVHVYEGCEVICQALIKKHTGE